MFLSAADVSKRESGSTGERKKRAMRWMKSKEYVGPLH